MVHFTQFINKAVTALGKSHLKTIDCVLSASRTRVFLGDSFERERHNSRPTLRCKKIEQLPSRLRLVKMIVVWFIPDTISRRVRPRMSEPLNQWLTGPPQVLRFKCTWTHPLSFFDHIPRFVGVAQNFTLISLIGIITRCCWRVGYNFFFFFVERNSNNLCKFRLWRNKGEENDTQIIITLINI